MKARIEQEIMTVMIKLSSNVAIQKETFMTLRDTHEHENNKVFSYQKHRSWGAPLLVLYN